MNDEIVSSLNDYANKLVEQYDAYLFNLLKSYGITKDNYKEYINSDRLQITQYEDIYSASKIVSIVLDKEEIYRLRINYILKMIENQSKDTAMNYVAEMHIELLETIDEKLEKREESK